MIHPRNIKDIFKYLAFQKFDEIEKQNLDLRDAVEELESQIESLEKNRAKYSYTFASISVHLQ